MKLTDSALRAIEEFARNQNKYGSTSKASIQFLGNEGFLSFPTLGNNGSNQPVEQKFSFSLTEEEKQGSFECLQQANGQMNVMGGIQHRMRVQAQEDVYESTRRSMTQAAQNLKNKCTREIKPNQGDIGRKITKKVPVVAPSLYNRTTTSGQTSITTPNSSLTSNGKRLMDGSGEGVLQQSQPSQQSLSMSHLTSQQQQQISATSSHNNYNTTSSQDHSHHDPYQHHNNTALNGVVGDDVDHQRTVSSMGHNLSRNNGQQNHRNPDIMRKPIKERLIHLLALRPFKKLELYDRLTREGIKDRDRSVILNVLKTISYTRDNAYVLHRHIWNDVHEDWPFYSEQDRSTLKRRKPQNLTPPLSSDGGSSSTSGQSPNSQHNGSPPPAVKRPPSQAPSSLNNNINSSNLINDKYLEPAPKKPRISHYKNKQEAMDGGMRPSGLYDGRESGAFMNSRTRDNDDYYGSNTTPNSLEDSGCGLNFTVLATDAISKRIASPINGGQSKSNSSGNSNMDQRSQRNGNRANGTTQSTNIINTSSSSYDTTANGDDGFRDSPLKNGSSKAGFSDYPPITSVEQRRKYKTEFDKDYAEYRQLHLIMDKARRRFANLQQELSNVNPSERKYKEIQNQIIQEYKENNNNSSFQDKKQKFDYLHEKLSHIKKLVSDFDSRLTKGNVNGETQTPHAAY